MFSKHEELRASFKDVAGLSRGSPVRMGGVDIGRVVDLGYGEKAEDDTIYVHMSIVADEARRIKKDSLATVEGKGLLGDKMIVITVGSTASPTLAPGEMVKTKESQDLAQIVTDLKSTVAGAERVMTNLEKTTDAFADEQFHDDVKKSVEHLQGILAALDTGDGYIGRLLRDPAEADRLSAAVNNAGQAAAEAERLLASTRAVTERVRTGPGFAHELVYGESGEKALAQIGGAAEELGLALKGVRDSNSFAHNVLYEDASGEMVANLNHATEDLRLIVKDMREGKGTVGALLSDPSVYEDLKVLLGNVGRNRSLRALVRYSIRKDEESGRVIETPTVGSTSTEDSLETPVAGETSAVAP